MTPQQNKCIILGCGSSGGVPLMTGKEGGYWGACDPDEPKNRRTRCSLYIEYQDKRLLIDTSPDLREQFLREKITGINAILYTHDHADHVHGIDDLRPLYFAGGKRSIPVYGDEATLTSLTSRFSYLFQQGSLAIYPKVLEPHYISPGVIMVEGLALTVFVQQHGPRPSLGYRFEDVAYSTDFKYLDEAALEALQGVKTWIVDCVAYDEKPTHCHLDLTLEWIEKVKPERAYLIHMNQTMDYKTLVRKLPEGVRPAYDGLVVEF